MHMCAETKHVILIVQRMEIIVINSNCVFASCCQVHVGVSVLLAMTSDIAPAATNLTMPTTKGTKEGGKKSGLVGFGGRVRGGGEGEGLRKCLWGLMGDRCYSKRCSQFATVRWR